MKISISPKRLKEIVKEELQKKMAEEKKYNPEFAEYIYETLTREMNNKKRRTKND